MSKLREDTVSGAGFDATRETDDRATIPSAEPVVHHDHGGAWDVYEAPTAAARVAPGVSGEHKKPALVLVVDDDADHRDFCARRLAMLGCRVLAGADGEDAVRIAQTSRPDLILMDLVMPRTDGIEATNRLRGDSRTRAIRIVGMTNYGAKWQHIARTAGCDVVLFKAELIENFDAIARKLLPNWPSTAIAGGG